MKAGPACLAAVVMASSLPIVATAQDMSVPPVTTGSSGYLFPNDRYQREREAERKRPTQAQKPSGGERQGSAQSRQSARADDAPVQLDAAAQARVRASIEALVPEYNQRARRDGEAAANEWIRQQAFTIGQREGDIARQGRR